MSSTLVIVESPAKARMISGFLGKDFVVKASMGHVRDLPKSQTGVDIEHDFAPEYSVTEDKKKIVNELKKDAAHADKIILATDEDREGEAIAWHLLEAFGLQETGSKKIERIVFHEITKSAILDALEHPRTLDYSLVDAQQARRVLDRLVGYELSPLLWKKVRYGLSAGRVQSVAVRIVVEREREIMAFDAVEYWSILANLKTPRGDSFTAELSKIAGKKAVVSNRGEAEKVEFDIKDATFTVGAVERKAVKRNPPAPFTTSTLQQEASRKLGFGVKKTMVLAQRLYEGAYGEGLITYMRTDSVNLAKSAVEAARSVIKGRYGADYLPAAPRTFKTKAKGAQEAHEAIRPTELSRAPEQLGTDIEKDARRLYELIWKRTLACQMAEAQLEQTGVNIDVKDYTFRATGQVIKFPGFFAVYTEGQDDETAAAADDEKMLPEILEGEAEELQQLVSDQHFTKPPARYTEASLVKKLESEGIGRPSTYAPTISTVQTRGYIEKEGRALKPTDTGFVVNDFLVEHFAQIVDLQFTAKMEDDFDGIAEGEQKWQEVIRAFYQPFHANVVEKDASVDRAEATGARLLGKHPDSGLPVFAKLGRYGAMLQVGETESEDKPTFGPILKTQSMATITLEEALKNLELPREVGIAPDGKKVITQIGRFGPYIRHDKTYVSITEDELWMVELDEAWRLVEEKREQQAKALVHDFTDEGIQVKIGRWGPYVTNGTKNAKIAKDVDPEKLTLKECQKILKEAPEKKGRWGAKKAAAGAKKKPAAKKKAPAKKKPTTKK